MVFIFINYTQNFGLPGRELRFSRAWHLLNTIAAVYIWNLTIKNTWFLSVISGSKRIYRSYYGSDSDFIEWVTDWQTDWQTDRQTDRLTDTRKSEMGSPEYKRLRRKYASIEPILCLEPRAHRRRLHTDSMLALESRITNDLLLQIPDSTRMEK